MPTYQEITKQIESLQAEAKALRAKEVADVVARIREAIQVYGLSKADLGFGAKGVALARKAAKAKSKPGRRTTGGAPKYRSADGRTWTGRGRRPQWFLDALAAGKRPEDLRA